MFSPFRLKRMLKRKDELALQEFYQTIRSVLFFSSAIFSSTEEECEAKYQATCAKLASWSFPFQPKPDYVAQICEDAASDGMKKEGELLNSWFAWPMSNLEIAALGLHEVYRFSVRNVAYILHCDRQTAKGLVRSAHKKRSESKQSRSYFRHLVLGQTLRRVPHVKELELPRARKRSLARPIIFGTCIAALLVATPFGCYFLLHWYSLKMGPIIPKMWSYSDHSKMQASFTRLKKKFYYDPTIEIFDISLDSLASNPEFAAEYSIFGTASKYTNEFDYSERDIGMPEHTGKLNPLRVAFRLALPEESGSLNCFCELSYMRKWTNLASTMDLAWIDNEDFSYYQGTECPSSERLINASPSAGFGLDIRAGQYLLTELRGALTNEYLVDRSSHQIVFKLRYDQRFSSLMSTTSYEQYISPIKQATIAAVEASVN